MHRLKLVLSLLVVFLLTFLMGTPAEAYLITKHWQYTTNKYYETSENISAESVTAFGNANNAWNNVSNAKIDIYRDGSSPLTAYSKDGHNIVSKRNTGYPDYLMETAAYATNGYVTEFDVSINLYYAWTNSGAPDCHDVQNWATHEIGHALWSGDITQQSQVESVYQLFWTATTMYAYSTVTGETLKRTLEGDDKDGFVAAY